MHNAPTIEPGLHDVFPGNSRMAERCRAFDWSTTPLGAASGWSQSLRTVVAMMLESRHPMFLWWGPELIQLFNDSYLPSFGARGRDVAALGAYGPEHWAEIWATIGPEIEAVMARGESSWHDDHLVPIDRNGRLEDVWWTYGYSPVRDDDGSIGGVLVVVQETTKRVQAIADRDRLLVAEREVRAQAESALARVTELFRKAPAFMAVLRGPELVFEFANDAYYELVGRRDVIGKPLFEAIPDARAQGFEALLASVLETGQPFVGSELPLELSRDAEAPLEQRHITFVYAPLAATVGSEAGIFVLGTDVTEQVRARREVEQAQARLERLYTLTLALSTATSYEDVAVALDIHLTGAFAAVGTVVARTTDDGDAIEIIRLPTGPENISREWDRIPLAADVPLAESARTARSLFLEGRDDWASRYPDLLPLLETTGHHANMIVPLLSGRSVLGVLGVAFDAPRTFTADDRRLLLTVAEQAGQALERVRLLDAERHARAQAESANRSKTQFLAMMSHELRTPLNAIAGYTQLLQLGLRGPVSPEQLLDLSRIQKSQRHLLGLINEVLNYTRIEAGVVRYDIRNISLEDALTTCEALIDPQARAKGITLLFESCDSSLLVCADAEKLRQILLNLLTNALKFTNPGGEISVSCAANDETTEITVTDTGRGIPEDQLERIFEPFVQVDAGLLRTEEGLGLGLAISRELVRGIGGSLSARSIVGVGTTFTMRLKSAR